MKKTFILGILDGWGVGESTPYNAIAVANTPNYDRFLAQYSNTTLSASESAVGLPMGQMGNSEVGHLTIGAGRVIQQTLVRMDALFSETNALLQHKVLRALSDTTKAVGGRIHVFGLLSDGGIHSRQSHIETMYDVLVSEGIDVCMHVALDGRDTPPKSGKSWVSQFLDGGRRSIATLGGRYYAMDRDQNWDRIKLAYDAIVRGESEHSFDSALEYIEESYAKDESDEFIKPALFKGYEGVRSGAALICMNFRADRVRQLLAACFDPNFDGFSQDESRVFGEGLGMVAYSDSLSKKMQVLLPEVTLKNTLGEWISHQGMTQLRVAETEKYAHVTFFLNGGREATFEGESRALIPSPTVATYDLKPEMAAAEVTKAVVDGIGKYDLIVVNYANADMLGHTGNLGAAVNAVECIDAQLGVLEKAVLSVDGGMILTADHGNIECMWNNKNSHQHTSHTLNPVPFIYVGKGSDKFSFQREGGLADVAPTLLSLMGVNMPPEMEGKCLIV